MIFFAEVGEVSKQSVFSRALSFIPPCCLHFLQEMANFLEEIRELAAEVLHSPRCCDNSETKLRIIAATGCRAKLKFHSESFPTGFLATKFT